MSSFCGLNYDESLASQIQRIKSVVRRKIANTDIELLFKNWDYQTKSVDDLDKILSEMYNAAESGFYVAPINYRSRFKNIFGVILGYSKWFIYNKILLRLLFPFVSSDFQFKLRVIKAFDILSRRR